MSTGPTYTLHHIPPPPGTTIASGKRAHISPTFTAPSIPNHTDPNPTSLFLNALHIRKAVFCHEQHCSPTIEVDVDDSQSHHWVMYSSLPTSTDLLPAGTVRLVKANPSPLDAEHCGLTPAELKAMDKEIADSKGWTDPDLSKSAVWDQKEAYVMIGRMANTKEFRGRGYGKVLIDAAITYAQQHPEEVVRDNVGAGEKPKWKGLVCAHAQEDVVPFYRRCGFELDEGVPFWFEEKIRHVAVWKRVDVP